MNDAELPDEGDEAEPTLSRDEVLLAAAEAEAAERDLDDERGHLLREREAVVASASEIADAERDARDEVDRLPRRLTPPSMPSRVSRKTRRDNPPAGPPVCDADLSSMSPDPPPPMSLEDYGVDAHDDDFVPPERQPKSATGARSRPGTEPVTAKTSPQRPTPPTTEMYVRIGAGLSMTPEWREFRRLDEAYCRAARESRAREGSGRRLLPIDEGDIPGRNTTFNLADFGPEKLDADGRPLRGPPGGTVRKPQGPWRGLAYIDAPRRPDPPLTATIGVHNEDGRQVVSRQIHPGDHSTLSQLYALKAYDVRMPDRTELLIITVDFGRYCDRFVVPAEKHEAFLAQVEMFAARSQRHHDEFPARFARYEEKLAQFEASVIAGAK